MLIDRHGRVKIADFGLAKILALDPEALRLTAEGHVMGTPHYMAPEQVEHPLEVDHRADIYSLGVVFYEMLTGELPLGKFQPPSRRVSVDVRLDDVVLRALEKQPELRFQHVSEVKSRVEGISSTPAAGGGATADNPRPNGAPPKRSKLTVAFMLAVIAVVLLVLLAFGAVIVGLAVPAYMRRAAPPLKNVGAAVQPLAGGLVELVAVGSHPSTGVWWKADGTKADEGGFENDGSRTYPDSSEQGNEFVFRTRSLPAESSGPRFKFAPSVSWAGGGAPMKGGKPVTGYHLVAASIPSSIQTVDISGNCGGSVGDID